MELHKQIEFNKQLQGSADSSDEQSKVSSFKYIMPL